MGWSPPSVGRIAAALRRRFRIDARALAALRIALGALIVADIALRATHLTAFYTDQGVLPRVDYIPIADPRHLSIHMVSGEAWIQAGLFGLAAGVALALLVGYRTRLMTVGSWLLLVSLHNRMPMVLNGGDVLLRMLLFWAMFLPLGARWSVDRAHGRTARSTVLSVAGVGLLVQVLIVYLVNAAFKLGGDVWLAGNGIEYVLSLGQFTVLLGDVLAPNAGSLWPLDYLWLAMVSLAWLLIGLTGRRRTAMAALFVVMHLGMALTMRLGLFPLISIASLLPFLPADFWERLEDRLGETQPVAAVRRQFAGLAAWLPRFSVGDLPPSFDRMRAAGATVVPLCFLVLIVLWNVQYAGLERVAGHDVSPDEGEWGMELTRTDQYWNMFAPDPLGTDGWLVAPAELHNGTRVEAFGGGPVVWDRPPDVSATYPSARWRKYITRLWRYHSKHRQLFADYLCDRWERRHDASLDNVTAVYVAQSTRLEGSPEPTERITLAEADC